MLRIFEAHLRQKVKNTEPRAKYNLSYKKCVRKNHRYLFTVPNIFIVERLWQEQFSDLFKHGKSSSPWFKVPVCHMLSHLV